MLFPSPIAILDFGYQLCVNMCNFKRERETHTHTQKSFDRERERERERERGTDRQTDKKMCEKDV